jgi:hypothetical protein
MKNLAAKEHKDRKEGEGHSPFAFAIFVFFCGHSVPTRLLGRLRLTFFWNQCFARPALGDRGLPTEAV